MFCFFLQNIIFEAGSPQRDARPWFGKGLNILAGNRAREEWVKLLCDAPAAGAIPNRFLHHVQTKTMPPFPEKRTKKVQRPGLRRRQNRRTEWVAAGPVLLCCMHIMNIDLADYCA
jgi:hypothetical protein